MNLGGAVNDTGANTITFNTTSAVASGGFIVVFITCSNSSTLSSVSGGSLTWIIDRSFPSGFFNAYMVSAFAPSGLASGTTLTANYAGTVQGRSISGMSVLGVLAGVIPDATGGQTFSGTAWTTPSMLVSDNAILIAGCCSDLTSGGTSTVTATTPTTTENGDRAEGAGGYSVTLASRILVSAGWYTVSGAWTVAGAAGATIGVAYKADIPDVIIPSMVPVSMVGRSY